MLPVGVGCVGGEAKLKAVKGLSKLYSKLVVELGFGLGSFHPVVQSCLLLIL